MSHDYHRLPSDAFDELAAGGGSPAVIDLLRRAQHSKHLLLLHGIAAAETPGAGTRAAYDLLARAQRADPDTVAAVIRHPSVGAWAHHTMLALRYGPRPLGATPDGLAAVAAAATIRVGLRAEIDVPAHDGLLVLPSLGAAELSAVGMHATVRIARSHTEVRTPHAAVTIPADYRQPAPGWRPLRRVLPPDTAPFDVVVDDVDPFRMPAALHLAAAPDLSRWRPAFADAWTLLQRHHPAVAAEVAAVITVAVPLAIPARGQVSSSSSETFGAIAMSEPVDGRSLAVTLTHEVQHMKLSAVLDLIPLTRSDDGSRYYAPWRDDPRPASGLLQGAYAYLGVTGFWRRQRVVTETASAMSVADAEFARWRDAAALVTGTLLSSGQLTADGERFVRVMAATLRAWRDEPVPAQARRLAHEQSARHMVRWQDSHGPIPDSKP